MEDNRNFKKWILLSKVETNAQLAHFFSASSVWRT